LTGSTSWPIPRSRGGRGTLRHCHVGHAVVANGPCPGPWSAQRTVPHRSGSKALLTGPEEKLYLKSLQGRGPRGFPQRRLPGARPGRRSAALQVPAPHGQGQREPPAHRRRVEAQGAGRFGLWRSLVRHALYAVWRAVESGEPRDSLTWLRTEVPGYWGSREAPVAILGY
jgi:hypothetical protein